MIDDLPAGQTLSLSEQPGGVLQILLNRPDVRNAMSLAMVAELEAVLDAVRDRRDVRVLVIRGAGGHFCAGGDVRDMAAARAKQMPESPAPDPGVTAKRPRGPSPAATADGPAPLLDPIAAVNRAFGSMITKVDRAPQAVIAILEGAVLGGGFGLACVADIAIARADAMFGLPETGLGLPPAQIAPFLVRRLGFSHARRLAVTGGRFDGRQAAAIGLVHAVVDNDDALASELARVLTMIHRCAPGAIAATKHLIAQVGAVDHERLLDEGAVRFAEAVRGPEGNEGTLAFLQKRTPAWAQGEE